MKRSDLKEPTLYQRLLGFIAPLQMMAIVFGYGIGPAVRQQLSNPSMKLLSPAAWWDFVLSAGFPVILKSSDEESAAVRKELMKPANGRVLEVGAGAGHNVKHYPSGVKEILGLEPFVGSVIALAFVQLAELFQPSP